MCLMSHQIKQNMKCDLVFGGCVAKNKNYDDSLE